MIFDDWIQCVLSALIALSGLVVVVGFMFSDGGGP